MGHINLSQYMRLLWKYRYLYISLVKRDFKGKYRNSAIGYLWHVINPLSILIIYYVVFSTIFGRDIPNYWAYLAVGIFTFTMISQSITSGSSCIISNKGMITKMSIPREIIVFSRITSFLINTAISFCVLLVIFIIARMPISVNTLLAPIILLLTFVMCLGLALIFSSISVYYHDFNNAAPIITRCMHLCCPIFFVAPTFNGTILETILWLNPATYFVETLHICMYQSLFPGADMIIACTLISTIIFVVGLAVFKKLEKGFAERL